MGGEGEDLLEKAVWSQHLKVGGCGSFTHCQQTFSGVPYAQLLPDAKSNMEGVLGQPGLAGAWVRAWVTSSNFLSVGVVSSFVNVTAAGAGRMTMTNDNDEGLDLAVLSWSGILIGTAKGSWRETGEAGQSGVLGC